MMRTILIYFSFKYHGNWEKIYQAIDQKEKMNFNQMDKMEKLLNEKQLKVITILDLDYPDGLKNAYKPLFVLWLKGDEKMLNKNSISIIESFFNEKSKERIKKIIFDGIAKYSFLFLDKQVLLNKELQEIDNKIIILSNQKNFDHFKSIDLKTNLFISEIPWSLIDGQVYQEGPNYRLFNLLSEKLIILNSLKTDFLLNKIVNDFFIDKKEIFCFLNEDKQDYNHYFLSKGIKIINDINSI